MALTVLCKFASLSEANVAAAALRAAGFNPVLLDAAAIPPYSGLFVQGGFRLAVSDAEASDAAAALTAMYDAGSATPENGASELPEEGEWQAAAEPAPDLSLAALARALTAPRLFVLALLLLLAATAIWAWSSSAGRLLASP